MDIFEQLIYIFVPQENYRFHYTETGMKMKRLASVFGCRWPRCKRITTEGGSLHFQEFRALVV